MSEDGDRMERAERIRRMRESARSDTNGHEENDTSESESRDATAEESERGDAGPDEEETGAGADGTTAGVDDEPGDGNEDATAGTGVDERGDGLDTDETADPSGAAGDDRTVGADGRTRRRERPGSREETSAGDATGATDATTAAADSAFQWEGSETDEDDTMSGQALDTDQQHSTDQSTEHDHTDDAGHDETTDTTDEEPVPETATEPAETTDTDSEESTEGPAGVAAETETNREFRTRVLEFTLGEERYCLDIGYIEEIVKRDTITRVPNTPEYVQGVVDLRGQITTILNPKPVMDIDDDGAEELIVVFDADEFDEGGAIGWLVDDVRQVTPVTDDQVNDPPIDEAYINGVIDREEDDQFVIWTTPDLALDDASS